MFVVTVMFEIAPDRMERFLPLILENARQSKDTEPGCIQFDVCRAGTGVFLYEVYANRAAFDAHLATRHFQSFDAAVADMIVDKTVTSFDEVYQ